MQASAEKIKVMESLQMIGLGVLDAVVEGGHMGAPSGPMYAAMQAHGASLNQYNSFMDGLVSKGMLTLDDSHCYHITEAGKAFHEILKKKFNNKRVSIY